MVHQCPYRNRIEELEKARVGFDKDISSLVDKLSTLTWWMRALVITMIPCVLGAFGYLFLEAFKR